MMNRQLKTLVAHLIVFVGFLSMSAQVAISGIAPPAEGTQIPQLILPTPQNADHRRYLRLDGGESFQVSDIKASVVIIEIYSLYCPYCQEEAPMLNELYQAIEKAEYFSGKIKLIGIGVGNTSFEVEAYRTTYNVPFPLFPDNDFTIHKSLGETRTPYFIAIKISDDGSHKVIYSKLGSIKEVNGFLRLIAELSGLEGGGTK
ncbi:MAG: TlpA family protein disulfide reductase [Desulfobacteraceae bacterium]|nr:TlpA family protein disulfide reductase [Desulfobacteraceae bacterium]